MLRKKEKFGIFQSSSQNMSRGNNGQSLICSSLLSNLLKTWLLDLAIPVFLSTKFFGLTRAHSRFPLSKDLRLLRLWLASVGNLVGLVCDRSLGDGIAHQKPAFNPGEGGAWEDWTGEWKSYFRGVGPMCLLLVSIPLMCPVREWMSPVLLASRL